MLVGPEHFAGASVATVAGGVNHSAAVTEGGALSTAKAKLLIVGSQQLQLPGGLGHADLANRLVPTPVSPRLLGGARVGRCHDLAEEHALAFAMGTRAGWERNGRVVISVAQMSLLEELEGKAAGGVWLD